MNNVYVNGRIETIANDRDIVDIIREHCGNDFADYVEGRLSGYNHKYTPEEIENVLLETDYYSYEASLDAWNCCGNDIVEECEKQMEYIENSKRVNKDVLYNSFTTIVKRVQGIL